jgi:hypothetical protein
MEKKREIQPGDLIWADRSAMGLPYNHCGIYEGAGYVIHFASPEGSEINPENAIVHRAKFEHFKNGCPVKLINIKNSFSGEETLRRARRCFGMQGYDFTTFNCDHFATWCKTGKYRSIQVDQVKTALKESDSTLADVICEAHDLEETLKSLKTVLPDKQKEIEDALKTNSDIIETIPPVSDDKDDSHTVYEIPEDEPEKGDEGKGPPTVKETLPAKVKDLLPTTIMSDPIPTPFPKKAWYERVADVLKFLTHPIAAGLEFVKRKTNLPIIRDIDFLHLGAKVRNVIDNAVTNIKVFTGRLTPEQGAEERKNNEAALAGAIIAQKQKHPVKETLKQVFGKVGSVIKHVVQQVVTRVIPAPVREAIKVGAKTIGTVIVKGVKAFVKTAAQGIKAFFGGLKRLIFG